VNRTRPHAHRQRSRHRQRQRELGLALTMGLGPWVCANALEMNFSGQGEVYALGQGQTLNTNAPFNPDNVFLHQPRSSATVDSRVELRAASDPIDFNLRLRGIARSSDCQCADSEYANLYATQAYARLTLDPDTQVTVGRQLLTWGPATFRSPSNPFYFDAGRTRPLSELSGIDALRLTFSQGNWSLNAAQVFTSGQVNGPDGESFSGSQLGSNDFNGTSLLRLDMLRETLNLGLVVAKQWRAAGFIGGYASLDLDEAWRVWTEAGWGQRPWTLTSATSRTSYLVTEPSDSAATALAGASYTFLNGQSVQLEYLFDGHGLSSSDESAYFDTAELASANLRGALAAQSAATLGQGLGYAPASLSKHYLSAMWQSSPQNSGTYWRAMWIVNMVDGSHQPSLYVEYPFSDRASWILSTAFNLGTAHSDFGSSPVRSTVTAGLKFNLF
jgi:hypothetical protein